MKLIIDIDEDTYKDIKKGKVYSSMRDVPQESVLAIANGIPLEPKSGKWKFVCQHWRKCSECGYSHKFAEDWNYCPNCGARMVEPQESESAKK